MYIRFQSDFYDKLHAIWSPAKICLSLHPHFESPSSRHWLLAVWEKWHGDKSSINSSTDIFEKLWDMCNFTIFTWILIIVRSMVWTPRLARAVWRQATCWSVSELSLSLSLSLSLPQVSVGDNLVTMMTHPEIVSLIRHYSDLRDIRVCRNWF